MFSYNLISVYCSVPITHSGARRANGEKLGINCLCYTKSFSAYRIFMKLKRAAGEGRFVQPQYHTCPFHSASETAASLVSISVWEKGSFQIFNSPLVYVSLPLHLLHVIIIENQIWGVTGERANNSYSGLLAICQPCCWLWNSAFRFYDPIVL